MISVNPQPEVELKPFYKLGPNYSLQMIVNPLTLRIDLQVFDRQKKVQKIYKKVIQDDNIPQNLMFLQVGLNQIFELCRKKSQIDTETGSLTIVTQFQVNNKTVVKKIPLILDRVPTESLEEGQIEEPAKQVQVQKQPLVQGQQNYKSSENNISQSVPNIIQVLESNTQKSDQPGLQSSEISQKTQKQYEWISSSDFEKQNDDVDHNKWNRFEYRSLVKKQKIEIVDLDSFQYEPQYSVKPQLNEKIIGSADIDTSLMIERQKTRDKDKNRMAKKSGKSVGKRRLKILHKSGSTKFVIEGNKITYPTLDRSAKQIVIDYKLNFTEENTSFVIKVLKYERGLSIGIVDQNNIQNAMTQTAILYHGRSARVTQQNMSENQGGGFKPGDVVKVIISRGRVRWLVNDRFQASLEHQKLHRENMFWYPIVEMNHGGEEVFWLT